MLLPASILALLSVRVATVSLVTVATDATEGFCDLAWSAIVHGHVLHVLEWASAGAEFTVATSKMEALAAFAREAAATSPDELVLTVDGYDVIVQASPAAITRQVREVAPGGTSTSILCTVFGGILLPRYSHHSCQASSMNAT